MEGYKGLKIMHKRKEDGQMEEIIHPMIEEDKMIDQYHREWEVGLRLD